MRLRLLLITAVYLIVHGSTTASAAGGVLAIDYGTEWMKVSLVKPGVAFDVLLNTDSKRKIQSVAAVKGNDRWIGGDAASLASRFPDATYPAVKLLLGHGLLDAQSQMHRAVYRSYLFQDPHTNKTSYHSEEDLAGLAKEQVRWPEEILALQFAHARKLAKTAAAGEDIVDTVVTVPAFFTQAERRAVADAVDIAGLRLLGLIGDGAAIAVNYAMTRTVPVGKVEHHLFYDAGAGSVRATIVSFSSSQGIDALASKTAANITHAEVRGFGWNRDIGGLVMDAKIRDLLEVQFINGQGRDLATSFPSNRRAQAKLLKEAARVKQVLSANVEASARVEGLAEEVDFQGLATREAFDTACGPFKADFAKVIIDALGSANMSVTDLTSVILVGGASRVPLVQAAVRTVVPEEKIAQNLNADEASVMGAALYGAGLSKQFKTKEIRIADLLPHPIEVAYDLSDGPGGSRVTTQLIHAAYAKVGSATTLAIKHTRDMKLRFSYKANPFTTPTLGIVEARITGITDAWQGFTDSDAEHAAISVGIRVDESGLLAVDKAQIDFLEAKSSVTDRIKGFFGGKDSDKPINSNDTDLKTSENSTSHVEQSMDKRRTSAMPLAVDLEGIGYASLGEALKKESVKRLKDLDAAEVRKRNREEARNLLEAQIYRLRDQLQLHDFIDASTESERVTLRRTIEASNQWLWDEGDQASTKELKAARSELERAAAAPENRIAERRGRSEAITNLRITASLAQAFLSSAQKQLENDTATGQPSKYTEVELTSLRTAILTAETWLEKTVTMQDRLANNVDPLLTVIELDRRKRDLMAQLAVLQAKRPPRKLKSASTSPPASATESASTSTLSTSSLPQDSSKITVPAHKTRDEL